MAHSRCFSPFHNTERARSISPTKDSPPFPDVSPSGHALLSASVSSLSIEPPVDLLPSLPAVASERASLTESVSEPGVSQTTSPASGGAKTTGGAMDSASSGTLSWKQRPVSKENNTRAPAPSSHFSTRSSTEFGTDVHHNVPHHPKP